MAKHTPEEIAEIFGMKNPKPAIIVKDVKTKLGLAFTKGERVTVWESGAIESGPYTGKMGYSAFSTRNDVMTAIRPSHFSHAAALLADRRVKA